MARVGEIRVEMMRVLMWMGRERKMKWLTWHRATDELELGVDLEFVFELESEHELEDEGLGSSLK
jgi:hypothetical protein